MRVLERHDTLHGSVYRPLPLSMQTSCNAEDVLRLMRKHVAADGSVDGLLVQFENTSIAVTRDEEMQMVAHLAAAHNNALVDEHFKHEKGLDRMPYTCSEADSSEADSSVYYQQQVQEEPKNSQPSTRAPTATSNKNEMHKDGSKLHNATREQWDEEVNGDRFVYDEGYQQHEDLLPWRDVRKEEQFGWYM
jgi:tRNA U55 pseudouridine synthase TruB